MNITKNNLGAHLANGLYSLYILMFILRLMGYPQAGHWLASIQFAAIIPLVYLLSKTKQAERPALYRLQIYLMLGFLVVEFLLDYVFQFEFRSVRWMVITYVTFFFAATGGLLGLASYAEKRTWRITAVALYLVMAVLAFVQRAVTGM